MSVIGSGFMDRFRLSTLMASLGVLPTVAPTSDDEPLKHVISGGWRSLLGLGFASATGVTGEDQLQMSLETNGFWHDLMDFRIRLYWLIAVLILLAIAAIANPNEASFRSHLTELSFRRHLAYFRSNDGSVDDDEMTITDSTSNGGAHHPTSQTHEIASVAPFRFASHVSVSLRTPPLHYRTLFFFSLALTAPLAPPIFLPDLAPTPTGRKHCWPRERVVLFIGYFGYWSRIGMVPKRAEWLWRLFTDGPKEKGKRKSLLDKPGVMGMRSIMNKEDHAPTSAPKTPASIAASKLMRKSDSVSNLVEHAHANHVESRRSSIVNLVSPSPQAVNLELAEVTSPLLTALKGELATAQTALSDIQGQLTAHEEAVSRSHGQLQGNLEKLRMRRKEDDAERQELKSKTKALDEQKRQAEAARKEAEKKLRAVEQTKEGLESKITAALAQLSEVKGLMAGSRKNVEVLRDEGSQWVKENQESVEVKKRELEECEAEIGDLEYGNSELLKLIKEAELRVADVIKAGEEAKKVGPEEEMMMMAAAYEAAAQEGYQHHGGQHRDQWANQAAAYMAEAGMPYLDRNYTARPTHSSSFAHLSKQRQDDDLGGDVYEDFGPGIPRSTTPPASSDSGSDVWGHDPGSPNGGISTSFSANLLPQELFRSLEGDQASIASEHESEFDPVPAPETGVQRPSEGSPRPNVNGNDTQEQDDHSSDSSSSHGQWASPMTQPSMLTPIEGKLRAPSITPPNVPALPGLPGPLPGRRWFSGTSSAENLSFGGSTSNDSLVLGPGASYEASPFAPSALEKKALALKWGPLSRNRWSRPNDTTGGDKSLVLGRSTSLSNDLTGSSGQAGETHTLTAAGSKWLTSRFSSATNPLSSLRSSISNDDFRGLASKDSKEGKDLHLQSKASESDLSLETGGGDKDSLGESPKKSFRFFSLRRPTSSGQNSMNSTKDGAGQLSTTTPRTESKFVEGTK